MRHEWAFFDLEDCGTLNTFESMPRVLGNVNTISSFFMAEDDAVANGTIIIKRRNLYLSS